MNTKIIQIDDLKLQVLEENKRDTTWYLQRKTFEERHSQLYPLLSRGGYATFIDIGANYGFISMLARKALPQARIVSVEADPRLAALIAPNFQLNGLAPPEVLNAIAGDQDNPESLFCLNPHSSLDNRVTFAGWKSVHVPTRAVGALLNEKPPEGYVFIKIDTQGYETKVLAGMENWLLSRKDWLLKMEFAPNWLQSQQHDPLRLLQYLADRFDITEYPERLAYNTYSLHALFDQQIQSSQLEHFLQHVVQLNQNSLGWVDLMVRPKVA